MTLRSRPTEARSADRLLLRYPNGRTYELVRENAAALAVGHEFEAFGRIWRVGRSIATRDRLGRGRHSEQDAFECYPITDLR